MAVAGRPRGRPKKNSNAVSPIASSWVFDEKAAEGAMGQFEYTARQLAQTEADRLGGFRSLARAAREFIVTLFPMNELDKLKREIGQHDKDVTLSMPQDVSDFLYKHRLPQPYWTARNPFLGIIQAVWSDAVNEETFTRNSINIMDGIPSLTDEGLEPADVANIAQSRKPEDQDKIIEPTVKTANANYVMISRWAMLVCASIDRDDINIIEQNPITALKDYVKWREKHRTLALPKPTSKRGEKKKSNGDDDEMTDAEKARVEEWEAQNKESRDAFKTDEASPEPNPQAATSEAEAAPEAAPETAPEAAPETAPEAAPEAAPETAPEAAPETAPETAPEAAPEAAPETASEAEVEPESPSIELEVVKVPRDLIEPVGDITFGQNLQAVFERAGIKSMPDPGLYNTQNEVESWVRINGQWFGPNLDPMTSALVAREIAKITKVEAQ